MENAFQPATAIAAWIAAAAATVSAGIGLWNARRESRRSGVRLRVRFVVHEDAIGQCFPAVEVKNAGDGPVLVDGCGVCTEKRGMFRKKPGEELGGDAIPVDGRRHVGERLVPKAAFKMALASAKQDNAWLGARAWAEAEGKFFFSGRLRDELPDFAAARERG